MEDEVEAIPIAIVQTNRDSSCAILEFFIILSTPFNKR